VLLCVDAGCVDAGGTVLYFNVSNVRVHRGDDIVLTCGTTLQRTEATLIVHIEKWFPGSMMKWSLTSNEEVDVYDHRYNGTLKRINGIDEFKLTVRSKNLLRSTFCIRQCSQMLIKLCRTEELRRLRRSFVAKRCILSTTTNWPMRNKQQFAFADLLASPQATITAYF